MASPGYARIKEVFFAVCELPPSQIGAALDNECVDDPMLRHEVESLLAHHQDESVLAVQSTQKDESRVVQVTFGRGVSAKWNEEQRKFLHQRVRVWILIVHLLVGLVLFRTFTLFDSWSNLTTGSRVGIVVGCLGLSGLSIFTLALRSPSFAWLQRLDLALLAAAFFVICSWSYSWLSNGISVQGLASRDLEERLANVYWAITSSRITLFRLGPAMISFPVANYLAIIVGLYGIIIPQTPRRILLIILGMMLVTAATILAAAAGNPVLRTYLVRNIFACWMMMGISAPICAYIGLKFQALRRAVFDATQVGQYQLTRLLGKGGMGEVYLGQHRLLRRPCAVKLIRPDQAGSEQALLRFEREVQAMAQLTHPNTVEVYDFGRTEDDTFFYAMEYLPGTTLDSLVRSHGPLPPGRVVYLLEQICSALSEAHQKGLIHRDIKPSNIFVCERGGLYDVIKLLDFGLVHIKDAAPGVSVAPLPRLPQAAQEKPAQPAPALLAAPNLTQTGQLLGTPAYMAPEQIEQKQPDARSDIYSLGGVACFLLSGRPPFERQTLLELFAAHVDEPAPRLREQRPELPLELESVIIRCLAKNSAARFQDVEELAAALAATPCSGEWSGAQAKVWWRTQGMPADPPIASDSKPA